MDNFFKNINFIYFKGIFNNNTNDVLEAISLGANVNQIYGNTSLLIERINYFD